MFDTMKVAKKIREARIAQNMTQMNLADAMEVSYQAVSNWERGNSMPDISKLEQLCSVLNISLEELLGADSSATTLTKIIQKDNTEILTIEEISEVLPVLPPTEVKKLVESNVEQSQEQKIDFCKLIGMAPFLDQASLDELVRKADMGSINEVIGLAPFLGKNTLTYLTHNLTMGNLQDCLGLAPFLDDEALDALADKISITDSGQLCSLAPFLSKKTLNKLVNRCLAEGVEINKGLYPFLSQETLRKLAQSRL